MGVSVLDWIVDQPDCDKGTALAIYQRGNPYEHLAVARVTAIQKRDYFDMETIDLLACICSRWADGKYKTYDFHPSIYGCHGIGEREDYETPGTIGEMEYARRVPWPVPDDMVTASYRGRVPDMSGWTEGYPNDLLISLGYLEDPKKRHDAASIMETWFKAFETRLGHEPDKLRKLKHIRDTYHARTTKDGNSSL